MGLSQFRVGDRVQYIGDAFNLHKNDWGKVVEVDRDFINVIIDGDPEAYRWHCYTWELKHDPFIQACMDVMEKNPLDNPPQP